MATMIGTALGSGGGATAPHSLPLARSSRWPPPRTLAGAQDPRVLAAASSPLVVVIATSKATSKSYKAACTLSLATCLPSLPSDKCLKAAFAAATSLRLTRRCPLPASPMSRLVFLKCGTTVQEHAAQRTSGYAGAQGRSADAGRRGEQLDARKEVVAKASVRPRGRTVEWRGVGVGGGRLEDEDPCGEWRPRRHHALSMTLPPVGARPRCCLRSPLSPPAHLCARSSEAAVSRCAIAAVAAASSPASPTAYGERDRRNRKKGRER